MNNDEEEKNTELEQEFLNTEKTTQSAINFQLAIARQAIDRAVEISEAACIPFTADVSPLCMGYLPESFATSKFKDIDLHDLLDRNCREVNFYAGGDYGQQEGWQHSDVC